MSDGTLQPRSRNPLDSQPDRKGRILRSCLLALTVFNAFLTPLPIKAQAHRIESPSLHRVEAGTPLFSVISHEAMGLDSGPTDLQILPDGRAAVLAGAQLALGDGVRWASFHRDVNAAVSPITTMAVDDDGALFMALPGGFGRVEFKTTGKWGLVPVAEWRKGAEEPILPRVMTADSEWYWCGDSGPLFRWNPGADLKQVGSLDTVEAIFRFRGKTYISDRTNGGLLRADADRLVPVDFPSRVSVNDTITCAVPFGPDLMLVGTYGNGFQVFDGTSLRPFAPDGIGANNRINDLKAITGSLYVAAIEGKGLALMDAQGQLLQLLDKSLDHRLSSITRLAVGTNGLIWGQLDGGILRVEMPSKISHYEPLIETGLATAQPYRHNGDLWLMVDGRIVRAVYDSAGRLSAFKLDSPPNRFAFAFSCDVGVPLVGTEAGAYFRNETGWVSVASKSVNLRILDPTPRDGRWAYSANGEVGWISRTPTGFALETYPIEDYGTVYNSEVDRNGDIWVEGGNARVYRVRFVDGKPRVTHLGPNQGIPDGWAQLFKIDDEVRLNVGGKLFRFSETSGRYENDTAFSADFPEVSNVVGRPGKDALGRMWISATDRVQVYDKVDGKWTLSQQSMPLGFLPYFFTFEENGVVWMHSKNRLARYDPRFPEPPQTPYRALFTHVSLPGSNRMLHNVGHSLPELPFSDNSVVAHFVTPGSPLGTSVNFEVKLEGSDNNWVLEGNSGIAVFNHLKEGAYVLHVRPVIAGSAREPAELAFVILPPWYRSGGAYALYLVLIVGVFFASGRFASFLQRRENGRLEHLVAQRTRELNEINDRLESQVEEISLLNQAIEQSPVAVYIVRPEGTLVFANPRACELSGYQLSELIGENSTLLRSEATPPELISLIGSTVSQGHVWRGQLKNRRKDGHTVDVRTIIVPIRSADASVRHHLILEEDISASMAEHEQRRRLETQLFQAQKLESLGTLAGGIAHDFNNILTGILGFCELARLAAGNRDEVLKDLEEVASAGLRAKDLVAQILTFSRQTPTNLVPVDLAIPVTEALKLVRASTPSTVEFTSHLESTLVRADKTQIQQIVLNLCTNAAQAIQGKNGRVDIELKAFDVDERLALEVPNLTPGKYARLKVSDNGCGMDGPTMERIFDPFFTTKEQGEGTGLGLSIVQGIVASHNGAHRVRSTLEIGTQFELFFPLTIDPVARNVSRPPIPLGAAQEILVLDDEKTIASFIASRLQKLGYKTEVFNDSRLALKALESQPTRFHGIVTDLTMPGLTGADLVARIRESGIDIPAIIVTGYGRDAVRAKLEALQNCTVLPKPFGGEELARAISEALPK